jgi:hypothetical protein
MLKKISLETMFDFILTALGAIIVGVSLSYGFGTLRAPGPGLYPFFIGAVIVLLSLILLVKGSRAKQGSSLFSRKTAVTFVLMIVTFWLWIVVMPFFGYVIVTFLVGYALAKIMRLEGWLKPLIISAVTAFFIYLLFDVWLYIDLPKGLLG